MALAYGASLGVVSEFGGFLVTLKMSFKCDAGVESQAVDIAVPTESS